MKHTWTRFFCLDCKKTLSYQGKIQKTKRCGKCAASYRIKNKPWSIPDGFKKNNSYGKKFYKGQPKTKGSYKKGHETPFEIRWKIRLANIGKRRSPSTEFKPSGRAIIYKRSKHITNQKYIQWRKEVFYRDNWTCQKCGQRGGKLQAHHKKSWVSYIKLRYSLRNGITLCIKCHMDLHHRRDK